MKSLKRTTKENPKKTWATIIAAIIGVATLFVEQAEILGVSKEAVQWASFIIAAVNIVLLTLNSLKNQNP